MLMKRKRGILLPETLKIIIAVLSIILLMILAVKLFNLFTSKTEIEQAKAALEQITSRIDELEEGETIEYLITGPEDWSLIAFNKGENAPSECLGENCLCICEISGEIVDDCEISGVCRKSENKFEFIQSSFVINHKFNQLLIYEIPLNLFLQKKQDIITMSFISLNSEQGELFINFLDSKSLFLGEEKTIREQILYFIRNQKNILAEQELKKNIQGYFQDHEYPIFISIKYENMIEGVPSLLAISAGKSRQLENSKVLPQWPVFLIENPGDKNIVVRILWRR